MSLLSRFLAGAGILVLAVAAPQVQAGHLTVDLLVDDVPVQCAVDGDLSFSRQTGRLQLQCQDGRAVDCLAQPWDWAYDQDGKHFVAVCQDGVQSAGIEVTINPTSQTVSQGGSGVFQVRIKNNGPGPLTDVQVATSHTTAGCARTFAAIQAGSQLAYSCGIYGVQQTTHLVFAVTGSRNGAPVGNQGGASVVVEGDEGGGGDDRPYVRLVSYCDAEPQIGNGLITWTVTVENEGGSPVRTLRVVEEGGSTCTRQLGGLPGGASTTFTCTHPYTPPAFFSVDLSFIITMDGLLLEDGCGGCTNTYGQLTAGSINLRTPRPDTIFSNGFD